MKALVLPTLLLLGACASTETHETSLTDTTTGHAMPAAAAVASYDKPGFVTDVVDGRLWIFREESEELATYRTLGEPAKHVIKPGAGPDRMTVKAPDVETIQAYMAAAPGFVTHVVEGRIWVFRDGDPALDEFLTMGEPAKHVIRVGAGPQRMTVKGPDNETIDAYLKAAAQ